MRSSDNLGWKYVAIILVAVIAPIFLLLLAGMGYANAVIKIPLNGDWSWYRDYDVCGFPEVQDEDIFYHNIGKSIPALQSADIVILGPSFSFYAFEDTALHQFSATHKIKIYNMSFIGIRSGEFSRLVIKKWHIRPRLWIINVDDQFTHFFNRSTSLTFGPKEESIKALSYNRLHSLAAVSTRNLRWRIADCLAALTNNDQSSNDIYRNVDTGSIGVSNDSPYLAKNDERIKLTHLQTCHVNKETIEIAKEYIQEIGGRVIFVLVPHSEYCPMQASELANTLGIELILSPAANYTTWDGGGHLDKQSAVRYTNYVMQRLVVSGDLKARIFGCGNPGNKY